MNSYLEESRGIVYSLVDYLEAHYKTVNDKPRVK